jgi:DNA-directed RNA polymerase specialized sigma subunit
VSKSHYINNKELENLINLYKEDQDKYGDELFAMFDILITNIMDSFGFEVEKDDAKQDCFLLILKTLRNFDTSKGSAFNFFTTIIVNNLKLVYSKNKKYTEKLDQYRKLKQRDL